MVALYVGALGENAIQRYATFLSSKLSNSVELCGSGLPCATPVGVGGPPPFPYSGRCYALPLCNSYPTYEDGTNPLTSTDLPIDITRHERSVALNRARDHGLDVEAVAYAAASLISREHLVNVCITAPFRSLPSSLIIKELTLTRP